MISVYGSCEPIFLSSFVFLFLFDKFLVIHDIIKLQCFQKIAEQKVLVRDAAVGYRSRLEKLEKLIFPGWLRDTNLNRFQRFLLALTIHTTKYSAVLQSKLLAAGITPYEFALAVDEFYDGLSTRFTHFGRIKTPTTDKEWEELYDYFGATDQYEKITLRISLEELPLPPATKQGKLVWFVL